MEKCVLYLEILMKENMDKPQIEVNGKLSELALEQENLIQCYHSKKMEYEQLASKQPERGNEYEKSE